MSSDLESERDFLLRSLDDLELERASGGIDEESYRELHDDYTARAAAVIRALRDGIDARPLEEPHASIRRRAVVVGGVVVFAVAAGVALAAALGARLPGQTSSGNSQAAPSPSKQMNELRRKVESHPDDYNLRIELAHVLEQHGDVAAALEQSDAAIKLDANRPEGHANAARLLYLASDQVADAQTRAQLVARALAGFNKAVEVAPGYPDAHYFRAVLLSNAGDAARAEPDLQNYLRLAPNGEWSNLARELLAQVEQRLHTPSTTVAP